MGPSSVNVTSRFHESVTRNAFRSYLAEFISTFFYVLVVVGSGMSSRKLMPDASLNPTNLVVVAIANAFALSSVLYIAWDISGGHVNPAVTFAMAVGGHISIPTALFYWVAQLIASVIACLVLRVIVVGMHVPTYSIAEEMTGFGASILEGLLTFVLVYTVYAARDPRRGPLSSTGTLVIGLIVGASVLAAGPFSGGSMNPACAFGSAAIAGTFRNQAVYWVGPLIGATIAGLLYDNVVFPSQNADSIRGVSERVGV
ncbi:probable aquaporin TIP5-1 [Gastrolobium bilobum]|uniref:probable aquaporin TIP5-1 n=1 Tax=Gastrolobium bilobum TaxID=150636 RepID=UPI002AB2408A|nr:probable aquaporin TIP5-1 [Gastrolobium bilobum]